MSRLSRLIHIKSILLVYILLAVAFSVVNPLFESPDEWLHYRFVRYLIDRRELPVLTDGELSEYHQPPLYYALGALLVGGVPVDSYQPEVNPFWGYNAHRFGVDNKVLYVHTDRESFPYRGTALAAHLLRGLSIALGGLSVLAGYTALRDVFDRKWLALGAITLVAWQPQFIFISSSINNDNLATLCGALTLLWGMRVVRLGVSPGRTVAGGLLLSAALLTKISIGVLVAVVAIAVAVAPSARRDRVFTLASIMVILALSTGWWFARNVRLYGELTAVNTMLDTWGKQDVATGLLRLEGQLTYIWTSLWGRFGIGQIVLPGWVYTAWLIVGMAALAGLIRSALHPLRFTLYACARAAGAGVLSRAALAGLLLMAVMIAAMLSGMIVFALVNPSGANGRYLFPGLVALAGLMFYGLRCLYRPGEVRLDPAYTGATALAMLVFSTLALLGVLAPAYARPALLTLQEVRLQTQPADYRFGETAVLLGYRLDRDGVLPGEEVRVTLCWQVLSPTAANTYFYVHVIGPDNVIVARRESYPGLGRYPTVNWRPGEIFCDDVPLVIEDWAGAPAVYDVAVGLVNRATGAALTPISPAGLALSPALVSRIKARSPEPALSEVEGPLELLAADRLNVSFGGEIRLLDAEIVPDVLRSGEFAEIVLRWQAVGNPSDNYSVFVHVVDSGGGIIAQGDSQPRDGRYPTRFWDAGEVVTDVHRVQIPESAQSGAYDVAVGLYVLETGRRLPIMAPPWARGGHRGGAVESVHVGRLTISEEP